MTYIEAMELVKNGGHLQRPRMFPYDYYVRLEKDRIVISTNEGWTTGDYKPIEEDKTATDWETI